MGPDQGHTRHQKPYHCGRWAVFNAIFAFAMLCLMPSMASAQTTYSNTTSGAVSNLNTCASPLVRTFIVVTAYTVRDVDIGTLISHPQRGELRITLRSPVGTTARVFDRTGGAADNINALFNDEGTTTIAAYTTNDALAPAPPPYQRNIIPSVALNVFDGENALGTWQIEICDNVAANSGTFVRADLTITGSADLSLAKTVSNATPANGAAISYTLTLANAALSLPATGVTVLDALPTGVIFVSATGTGTYNATTGIWNVGTLAANTSVQLVVNVTVNASAGAVVTNSAEVSASSPADNDSTPGNGSTTEDDDASVNFTVSGSRVAGTPPTLVCPVGNRLFDWNTVTWPSPLSNSFSVTGIGSINFALSTDNPYVAGSPTVNSNLTGGLAATETSLFQNLNNTSIAQRATTVLTLPTAVPGMQFRIFDIDFGAASFADKITVTGTFNGSPVLPTLTNGTANYVSGNVAIGDVAAANNVADGTVFVTFAAPVDTVTITYGTTALRPLIQAISSWRSTTSSSATRRQRSALPRSAPL
jgi:uncharacterized repeat protein (TIGR01451 family)